ncbi:MAG: segregation/condensation protein A [Planctomycetales bacterium]|nr:segregation/condensation protein A [Planctomycetales bacterium]
MAFVVEIEQYSGPIELLLHIVRRDELLLSDISLSRIIDQYLDYLEVLTELQIDDVADFIEIATVLVEMKSKESIPTVEDADSEESLMGDESSGDLVHRLLEYKRIRDAACILDELGQRWQMRYSRLSTDLPPRRIDAGQQPIEPIEVWDLVSAFGRILRERQPPPSANVVYDDTPIHVHMERIHHLVCEHQKVELTSLFEAGMHKSALVAMFLATLELTRHHGLSTQQRSACEPLYLVAGKDFVRELDVHKIDNLSFEQVAKSNLPVAPR